MGYLSISLTYGELIDVWCGWQRAKSNSAEIQWDHRVDIISLTTAVRCVDGVVWCGVCASHELLTLLTGYVKGSVSTDKTSPGSRRVHRVLTLLLAACAADLYGDHHTHT